MSTRASASLIRCFSLVISSNVDILYLHLPTLLSPLLPHDRMIHAYAFMLEGALGALRVQASGGDVGADHAIAAVHKEIADNLRKSSIAPDVLMLVARAFARAELDPGRPLQEAMMSAMEAQSPSMPAALSPEDFSDHFAEL